MLEIPQQKMKHVLSRGGYVKKQTNQKPQSTGKKYFKTGKKF